MKLTVSEINSSLQNSFHFGNCEIQPGLERLTRPRRWRQNEFQLPQSMRGHLIVNHNYSMFAAGHQPDYQDMVAAYSNIF